MGMAEQEKINRMQKNLSVIRNVARWNRAPRRGDWGLKADDQQPRAQQNKDDEDAVSCPEGGVQP